MSFLKRDANAAPANPDASPVAVQVARTRARQRLIGALVLLSIGVVGFPLLFESQPRPIPVDIPITIPGKDAAPPLTIPAPRPASGAAAGQKVEPVPDVITETQADAGRDVPAPGRPASAAAAAPVATVAPPASRPATRPVPAPATAPAKVAAPASVPAPAAKVDTPATAALARASGNAADAQRARALLNGQTVPVPASAAGAARFIVQIGAFADAAVAREARLKVEKLGLQTYTQVADTPGGKRIRVRVGPYAQRADADRAMTRLRAAGLPAALLTL